MMEPSELRSKLSGVIAFPVTPFTDDLSIDIDGLRRNTAEMAEFPLAAIVAAGGTGEMYSLSIEEHRQVVEAVVQEVDGKMPVIAGTGFGAQIAVELAKQSADAGADGMLCFPPYYPNAPFEGMLNYYQAIGESTPLGMLIYNRDWASFSPGEVNRLADAIPTLTAWKEGQADVRRFQMIMERVGDRLHWIGGAGDDMVRAYYSLGIRTYTSSIAAIAPRLSMQLHERASMLDNASLERLMSNYVLPLYGLRARRKGYEVSVMKAAMEVLGKPAGPVRPPLPNVRPQERKEIEALMERYEPVL